MDLNKNGWWMGPALILAVLAIIMFFSDRSHGETLCAPCKIIGAIKNPKGEVIEEFKYPFTFTTNDGCEVERASANFKSAMADLQAKATQLRILGTEFQNLTADSACVDINRKPTNP